MVAFDVSWWSRRSTWRSTRRFQDSDEPGKQPLTMSTKPFYARHIALYYCCIGIMMRGYHFGGLLRCFSRWYLHDAWPYLSMRGMRVGVVRMLSSWYANGMGICMVMEAILFSRTFQKTRRMPLMPEGDSELGYRLIKKWCTEASCVGVFSKTD